MKKSNRILELDVLRGLAVIGVILFHYLTKYNEEYQSTGARFSFEYGHFGVELFFLISGFVIFMTVDKVKNAKGFIWLRFSRLFPVYWSGIILTTVFVLLFGLVGREVSWKSILFNFTMLQELFNIPHVDGAYWSLLPELMFYFLMAIVLFFKKKAYINSISVVWLIAMVINTLTELPISIVQILNLKYGMLFVAGIQFYLIKEKELNKKKLSQSIVLIVFSILTYAVVIKDIVSFSIVFSFYILFFLLVYNYLKFLKIRWLIFIGSISYPLYIVHQNIGYILMNELNLPFLIEFTLAILLSIVMAIFIHYGIEKPTLKFLRKIKL